MSEYLIQENAINILAKHAKRVSGSTEALNGAEIAEIFSRVKGSINENGQYSVKATKNSVELKSGMYDTGEVFALPSPPNNEFDKINGESIYLSKFQSWTSTAQISDGNFVVVNDMDVRVGAIMEPIDDSLIIMLETEEENTFVQFAFWFGNQIKIDWGDGTIQDYDDNMNIYDNHLNHTYSNIDRYYIKIYNISNKIDSIISFNSSSFGGVVDNGHALIKKIWIPKWAKYLDSYLFKNLINLQDVYLADGVTLAKGKSGNLSEEIFCNCQSLETVEFPKSIKTLSRVFSTNKVYDSTTGTVIDNYCGIKSVILPYGVTEILGDCFRGCTMLTDVIIPDSVTSIGDSAFNGCSSLKNIVIPDGITSVPSYMFNECSSLESVVIPDSVTSIGSSAFNGCSSLKNIVIPDGVEIIESDTFNGCSSLESITIPNSVTSIDYAAFGNYGGYGHNSLIKTLVLQSVTSIHTTRPFGMLAGLKSIVLGANSICTIMPDYYSGINMDNIFSKRIKDFNENPEKYAVYIYVPDNLVNSYKADSLWSHYANYIKPISEYTGE